ncbi:group III truncated hemoglobin [Acidisoma sp. 7E03]
MTTSHPFPATEAERAETARRIEAVTGLNETVLEQVVRRFYERARQDAEIGAKFDRVQDWDHHIDQITAFWSSVALGTGRYDGRPMAAHMPLDLRGPHFTRWLALFEQTAQEICSPAGARYLMERARRIAASLEMGSAVARGEMPQAAPRPAWARP